MRGKKKSVGKKKDGWTRYTYTYYTPDGNGKSVMHTSIGPMSGGAGVASASMVRVYKKVGRGKKARWVRVKALKGPSS